MTTPTSDYACFQMDRYVNATRNSVFQHDQRLKLGLGESRDHMKTRPLPERATRPASTPGLQPQASTKSGGGPLLILLMLLVVVTIVKVFL